MDAEHILEELKRLPHDRKVSIRNNEAWMCCVNPDHSGGHESTPSAKINIDETSPYFGTYHCFGCGAKMKWNTFAKQMGLSSIDEDFEKLGIRRLSFRSKMNRDKSEEENTAKRRRFAWPEGREWRGIPGRILKEFGAFVPKMSDVLDEPYLSVPITMFGEEVGTIRALMRDPKRAADGTKLEKSYLNASGKWMAKSLLGFDLANVPAFRGKPLLITEGPRDVFRGYQANTRIVGLCGSKFNDDRAELIRLLQPCVLIIATDNDDAGNMAAESIIHHCDFVPCVRMPLPVGQDLFQQSLKRIKRWYDKAAEKYAHHGKVYVQAKRRSY